MTSQTLDSTIIEEEPFETKNVLTIVSGHFVHDHEIDIITEKLDIEIIIFQ